MRLGTSTTSQLRRPLTANYSAQYRVNLCSPFHSQRTHFYTLTLSMASLRQRPLKPSENRSAPASSIHSHSHAHSHSGHSHGEEETAALVSALSGSSDPGSRITLIGMAANVGLTGTKGVAGWALGSAALMADAAHSGSDLLADVVTLATYKMSRRPISASHPYGYGSQSRQAPLRRSRMSH